MGHLYGDPIEVRGADGAVVTLRREPDPGVGGVAVASGPVGDGVAVLPSIGAVTTVTAPASFLWRGRVYLVRGVLARWRERLPWWNSSAARLAQGDLPARPPEGSDEGRAEEADGWLQPFRGTRVGGDDRPARGSGHPEVPVPLEREVWRVEASCGRQAPLGVYDLCRELAPEETAFPVAVTVFEVPGLAEGRTPTVGSSLPGAPVPVPAPSRWHLLRVCD